MWSLQRTVVLRPMAGSWRQWPAPICHGAPAYVRQSTRTYPGRPFLTREGLQLRLGTRVPDTRRRAIAQDDIQSLPDPFQNRPLMRCGNGIAAPDDPFPPIAQDRWVMTMKALPACRRAFSHTTRNQLAARELCSSTPSLGADPMTTPDDPSHEQRRAAVSHLHQALSSLPPMDLSIRERVRELIDEIEALDAPL